MRSRAVRPSPQPVLPVDIILNGWTSVGVALQHLRAEIDTVTTLRELTTALVDARLEPLTLLRVRNLQAFCGELTRDEMTALWTALRASTARRAVDAMGWLRGTYLKVHANVGFFQRET